MILVCVRQFGNFLPGDEVPEEVPDDALFDVTHFARKPEADDGSPPEEDDE